MAIKTIFAAANEQSDALVEEATSPGYAAHNVIMTIPSNETCMIIFDPDQRLEAHAACGKIIERLEFLESTRD